MLKLKRKYVTVLTLLLVLLTGCGGKKLLEDDDVTRDDPMKKVDKSVVISKIGEVFIEPDKATDITYYWNDESHIAKMICYLDDIWWQASVWKVTEYDSTIDGHVGEGWTESSDNFGMGKTYQWNGLEGTIRYYYYDDESLLENQQSIPEKYRLKKYFCLGEWFDEDAGMIYALECNSPNVEELSAELFFTSQ